MSEQELKKNYRILKNSLFLYFRMFLLMGIGFFTTRKILEALGANDLGIYNVVGSIILMFDFVSSGLTNSTQRFLNIGLGKNDAKLTNQYFSQSLIVHVVLALVMALILEPVGLWFVQHKLVIPPERMHAAIVVFHLSVISLVVRLVKICFESSVIAREKMSMYAYLSVFEAVAKLAVCYAIIHNTSYDALIFYGVLLLLVNVGITLFNMAYCFYNFPETRAKLYTEKAVFQQLLSFVGVNSFGVISWALGKQGINVVMNMFFGPAINAAKGIAANIERVAAQFGSNVDLAIRPQITKLYAQEKQGEMISLAMKSTKYIFFIMLIVSTPFLMDTKGILSIWLKEVPPYTEVFVQILLFEEMSNALGKAFNNVSLATGKIKTIQVYGRLITLSGLPLSYVLLKIWEKPEIPVLCMVLLTLCYSMFIVIYMNHHLHFGMLTFVKKVLTPITIVCATTFAICFGFKSLVAIDLWWLSLAVNVCVSTAIALVIVVFLGVEKTDRVSILTAVKKKAGF